MITIKEITDQQMWESFLNQYHVGSYPFFQTWEWGEVLTGLEIPVLRFGIWEEDELMGVAMVVDIKAKRGHYLYLRHGPVFKMYTEPVFLFLINYLKKLAKEKKASFIRISRFPQITDLTDHFFHSLGLRSSLLQIIDAQVSPVLDLTKSEADLLKNMRKTHRYLIRKAQTMDIKIAISKNENDLTDFLKLLKSLSVERKFVVHKEIEEEFSVFLKNDKCVLFIARFEGKIIAYAIIDFVGDTAYYRHAASDKAYRHIPAAYLLLWQAILESKQRGLIYFNFMGIAPENAKKSHPWYGFTMFKTGFGAENEYYLPTMDLPLNYQYWKNYTIDWVTKVRKRY